MKRNKHLTTLAALALTGICTATTVGTIPAPQAPASSAGMACQADTVLYNGRQPLLLAIDGQTAYYVAPVDAASGITWNEMMNTPGICPPGWKVPSAEDFTAMSGIPADGNWVEAHHAALAAVFEVGERYWSSSSRYGTLARAMCADDDNVSAIIDCLKTSKIHVRCVRKK